MTKSQHRQFIRWLNKFADARESLHNAGGAPTWQEGEIQKKEAIEQMFHAERKLVQLFNSMKVTIT